MTRWVRSGNSQKHKKMPGNATKWGEFDNQYARKIPSKRKKNIESETDLQEKLQSPSFNFPSSKAKESLNEDFFDEDRYCLTENTIQMNEQKNDIFDESHSNLIFSSTSNDNSNNLLINKTQNPKMKKKKKQKNSSIKYSSLDEKTDKAEPSESGISERYKRNKLENDCSITNLNEIPEQGSGYNNFVENRISLEETFCKSQNKKKRKKKMKKNYNKIDSESLIADGETMDSSFNNSDELLNLEKAVGSSDEVSESKKSHLDQSSEKQKKKKCDKIISDSNQSSLKNDNGKNSSPKVFESKKEKYLKKLQRKREKLGLLLLPRNVETKLHKIQKKLKEKGFPPEKQKEIMREARRKEELKYRKVFNPSKLCFGCREAGHVLANCPKKSESLKQETGICFKCGSVEHTSFKCPEKVQGFPYAKCFICKEQGHISRECSKNKHGVYPKGGRCKLCGNVNHLKKDCPTLKKKDNEEETITLPTLGENASIDAEVVEKKEIRKKTNKKAKIVQF